MREEKLLFIKDAANTLTNKLRITNYPIIMLDLFAEHYADKYFIHYASFSDKADVVTNYCADFDECIIFINEKVVKPNLMKRLNFSLAHELGHLVLEHYKEADSNCDLPSGLELEAHEFAAQFLMPEDEIYFMPKKLSLISEYFHVSEIAASKRLYNMKTRSIRPNRFLSDISGYNLNY